MKRRKFIQWCLGIIGMANIPKAKAAPKEEEKSIPTPPPKVGDVYWTGSAKSKRSGYTSGGVKAIKFPDEIVGITKFQGRLIVACRHSVWQVEEHCDGFERRILFQICKD